MQFDVLSLAVVLLIIVTGIATAFYMIFTMLLLQRLRSHHPRIHEALGEPDSPMPRFRDWIEVLPFIWWRSYSVMNDRTLARWGAYSRTSMLVGTVAFVAFWFVYTAAVHITGLCRIFG